MVEFLTLFFGLAAGPRVVELSVAGPVATVEIQLDGETLTTLDGEPWTFTCDLGKRFLPHDLVAIARDASGAEVDRAAQWINMAARPSSAALGVRWLSDRYPMLSIRGLSIVPLLLILSFVPFVRLEPKEHSGFQQAARDLVSSDDLRDAVFDGADLDGTDFINCRVEGMTWVGATAPPDFKTDPREKPLGGRSLFPDG